MDQRPDVASVELTLLKSVENRLGADRPGFRPRIEETALPDSGHQFEPAGRQSETVVDRGELVLNLPGSDDTRRKCAGDGLDADVSVTHDGRRGLPG